MSTENPTEGMTPEEAKETQEILDDIAKDNPVKPEEELEETPKSEDEEETPEEKSKESEDEPEDKTEEEEEVEEEEDDEKPESKLPPKREPRTVPYNKYKGEKEKRKLLENDLNNLKSKAEDENKTSADIKDITSKMAEETGIDQSVFDNFANAIINNTKIPEEVSTLLQSAKEKEAWAKEDEIFENDFSKLEKEFPDEKLDKKQIKDLAFTVGNESLSLYELYFRKIKPNQSPKKKSAESAKPGTSKGETKKKYEEMTDAEIAALPDDEFDKASDAKASKHSRLIFE